MSKRCVVILSSRGLFREGLKHLLAGVATVALASLPEEVEPLLLDEGVDTVIVDQEECPASYGEFFLHLLSIPHMRIITVRLDVADIQIYQRQQMAHATPETLITAVME